MGATTASRPSLREAQRTLTRARIRHAAGGLLFDRGVGAFTTDEIASAAGISRSTLYLHYPDQSALLGAIATDYGAALCAHVERLPGPLPSGPEIEAWVDELARLIAREQVPATLIASLAEQAEPPAAVVEIGERLIAALAGRLPAFARALVREKTGDLARAWAEAAMRELGSAGLRAARQREAQTCAGLTVAARIFESFIRQTVAWDA